MSPEAYEELQMAAAEAVVFLRGYAICPFHSHVTIAIPTSEGFCEHHGPVCEVAPELLEGETCNFVEARQETIDKLIEALGTRDMSQFL